MTRSVGDWFCDSSVKCSRAVSSLNGSRFQFGVRKEKSVWSVQLSSGRALYAKAQMLLRLGKTCDS